MKNFPRFGWVFVVFIVLAFVSCSDSRVTQLEESSKKMRADISDLRSLHAEQAANLKQITSELRQLTGQIEVVQHVSAGKTQELEQTISQLKSRVPPPAGVPEDLLNEDDERIASNTGAAADQFRRGLQLLRTGDFEAARETFSRFAESNPGTAFTDNALFWLGIAYQKLGKYDQAVSSFSEVFQKYPAEDFVPSALFYLADSFIKLGTKEDAVLTLQKLMDEHPSSAAAGKARTVLAELQPPASQSNRSIRRKPR